MMATAIYFVSLGLASGIVGLWCRRLLAELGLIHGFEATLWAAAFVAVVYMACQVLFRAAVMLVKPVRARSFTITEILSQCTALLLVPSLAGFTLPIPYATLQKVEPLFHLAAFVAFHGLFKLMAFFAAVQGQPASRVRLFPWLAVAGLCGIAGYGIVGQYLQEVNAEQPIIMGVQEAFVSGDTYAQACKAPENVHVVVPLEEQQGERLSFLWAPVPTEEKFPETVFVSYEAYDVPIDLKAEILPAPVLSLTKSLTVEGDGWVETVFERSKFPESLHTLVVSWSGGQRDSIKHRLGLAAPIESGLAMMMSGPWQHTLPSRKRSPGIVVVVVEALGAENMNIYGYHRSTVPFLTERLSGMIVFEEAYTSTPETTGACMSLFTGLNPLAHHYYETFSGPLPDEVKTLPEILRANGYQTIAFTEGRGADCNDLYYGSGFERGFVLFDDVFPMEIRSSRNANATAPVLPTPAGAWATLQKAGDWIDAHVDDQYMVFIRLRDLRNPTHLPYYGNGFVGHGRKPDPVDIYDTAVTYVDKQLSAFIDRLHGLPTEQRPALVITSTHGFDFTEPGRGSWRRGGPPRRTLHETALRIPLLMDIPNRYGSTQKNLVSLEDVAATIAALGNSPLPPSVEGIDMLNRSSMHERMSMNGNPVALSMRTGRWRFTWQSGLAPFTLEEIQPSETVEFIDIERYRTNLAPVDNIKREPRLVQSFIQRMQTFIALYEGSDNTVSP